MQDYIDLYNKMIPQLSIKELMRQKASFEQDKNMPNFKNSPQEKILSLINRRLSEIGNVQVV